MSTFDLPPDEIRRLGRLVVDAVAENQGSLLERPVFGKVGTSAESFREPLPRQPQPFEEVLQQVRTRILPFPMGNAHPRFFGFINATPDPLGVFADFIAASMNPNCWGGDHAAIHVEAAVIRWLAEAVGFPQAADGILVSGGSMANFTAIATARRARFRGDVREHGMNADKPLVIYASDQVHACVDKAADLLGFGMRHLRKIPTDDAFRMDLAQLRSAIAADRAAGLDPAIVVGTAGTVNTGAIDPLEALADIARDEDMWFHVDGAYGALATLSPRLRALFRGIERADSVAMDPHKWMYVPFEAGATLVREGGRMGAAFRRFPEYLASDADSPFPGPVWFAERGVELSRSFKALKVWIGLKTHGADAYAASIERDCALAQHLCEAVDARPDLERLADSPLSIANFRFRPRGANLDDAALDKINRGIVNALMRSGSFFLAPTILRGRASIRVSITNFRTQPADLDALVDAVEHQGTQALAALQP